MKKIKEAMIFVIPFSGYLAAGLILLFMTGYLSQELNVRSGIAYDLLRGDERGREGLICSVWWAPLPTLLQLIFGIFPSLIKSGIAGIIISSAGGALMFFFLYKSVAYLGVGNRLSYLICLIVSLNPWIVFFASTGASEALMLGILMGALWGFLIWHFEQRLSGLVTMSLLISLLPLIKHQAIFLSITVLLAGIVTAILGANNKSRKVEGTIFLAISPTIYTVGLWFLFNWLIMGDFLYFLKGIYINPVQATSIPIYGLKESVSQYVNPWIAQFFIMPFLPAACIVLIVCIFQKRALLYFKYLAILAVLPIYHILMTLRHQSFNLVGDMSVAIPVSILLSAVFAGGLAKTHNPAFKAVSVLLIILTVAGTLFSYGFIMSGAMDMPLCASSTFPFVAQKSHSHEEAQIKEFILGKEEDSKIAVVGFSGYNFIRNSQGGDVFVHSINLDMRRTLKKTKGKTLYFVIPKPDGAAAFDSINLNLPGLYYAGETTFGNSGLKAHFMLESKDFPNWRIFTIVRPQQNETIFGIPKVTGKGS